MVGSQTLKRRSSDLISLNFASPLDAFLFMIRKTKIFKDQFSEFLHCDFCFIVVVACIFTCIALFAFTRSGVLSYYISDFTLPIAFTGMLLATRIIAETILIKGANWHLDYLLAIGEYNAFLADNIT